MGERLVLPCSLHFSGLCLFIWQWVALLAASDLPIAFNAGDDSCRFGCRCGSRPSRIHGVQSSIPFHKWGRCAAWRRRAWRRMPPCRKFPMCRWSRLLANLRAFLHGFLNSFSIRVSVLTTGVDAKRGIKILTPIQTGSLCGGGAIGRRLWLHPLPLFRKFSVQSREFPMRRFLPWSRRGLSKLLRPKELFQSSVCELRYLRRIVIGFYKPLRGAFDIGGAMVAAWLLVGFARASRGEDPHGFRSVLPLFAGSIPIFRLALRRRAK